MLIHQQGRNKILNTILRHIAVATTSPPLHCAGCDHQYMLCASCKMPLRGGHGCAGIWTTTVSWTRVRHRNHPYLQTASHTASQFFNSSGYTYCGLSVFMRTLGNAQSSFPAHNNNSSFARTHNDDAPRADIPTPLCIVYCDVMITRSHAAVTAAPPTQAVMSSCGSPPNTHCFGDSRCQRFKLLPA